MPCLVIFASRSDAQDRETEEAAAAGSKEAAGAPSAGGDEAPADGEDAKDQGGRGAEKTCEKPEKVRMGVHLNDIQSIDLKSHSYVMDFYVWFRWMNPELDPAASMEIVNPTELWGLMITPIYKEPEELEDGSLYQVLRVQGTFSKKLPLFNYPFDRQTLVVMFEDGAHNSASLVYVPDEGTPTVNHVLKLPGYELGTSTFTVGGWNYPTTFGDPRASGDTSYSRATLAVPISRPPVAYATKLFLPVVCVILCAALMFLLSPNFADARVDVGITSLLTIVALQMTYNTDLPDVGYLMLMDKVYLLAYCFVIVGLGVVVHTTRQAERGNISGAMRIHRRVLALFAGTWAVAMVVLVTMAVRGG